MPFCEVLPQQPICVLVRSMFQGLPIITMDESLFSFDEDGVRYIRLKTFLLDEKVI